jgi:hypothetical protein
MNSLFSARTARQVSRNFDPPEEKRECVLKHIQSAASKGRTSLPLDFGMPGILDEDDYKFFEKLGYAVKRPENRIYKSCDGKREEQVYYAAVISW